MTRGALLFDLDGTLTDPREGITRCIQHALETIGAAVPGERELQRWIGPPLQQSLRSHLGANSEALVDKGIAAYRERFAAIGMFENVVYAEIPAALAELKASGWAMFVATSKPSLFARQTVEHFGLSPYFSQVYGAELSGERSDKSELIEYLLGTENIAASRAVMIGDRAHDMIGAKRNAVRALGVLWGYGDRAELVDAGADAVVATVSELVLALREC